MVKKTTSSSSQAAVMDVFGAAASVAEKPKGKKGGKERKSIIMDKFFRVVVAGKVVLDALEGFVEQQTDQYKGQAFDELLEAMIDTKAQPESIVGVHENASCMFQFRQRSPGFSKVVAEQLEAHKIPFQREEKIPERFVFNPAVVENQALLGEIAMALKPLGEKHGIQIVQKQEPEYKYQVTDATYAALVENVKDENERAELARAVSTIAMAQVKLTGGVGDGGSLKLALQILADEGVLALGKKDEKKK